MSIRDCVIFVALAFATVGCPSPTDPLSIDDALRPMALVVGDHTARAAREEIASSSLRCSSYLPDEPEAVFVVLVVDAMQGPSPVHKELIAKLAVRPPERMLCVLANTRFVDDRELLELEELELREMFNSQGMRGDEIPFAFDSDEGAVDSNADLKGWPEIAAYVASRAQASGTKP